MKCPPNLMNSQKSLVCKLKKFIYGLKQVSRQCNNKLIYTILDLGFIESNLSMTILRLSKSITYLLLIY